MHWQDNSPLEKTLIAWGTQILQTPLQHTLRMAMSGSFTHSWQCLNASQRKSPITAFIMPCGETIRTVIVHIKVMLGAVYADLLVSWLWDERKPEKATEWIRSIPGLCKNMLQALTWLEAHSMDIWWWIPAIPCQILLFPGTLDLAYINPIFTCTQHTHTHTLYSSLGH